MKKYKLLLAALLAMLALGAFTALSSADDEAPQAPARARSDYYCSLRGDVDGDGKVTAADARILLRCAVRLEKINRDRANAYLVDDNPELTAEDARVALRIAVGLQARPTHAKQESVVLKAPTCSEPGSEALLCRYCGEAYSLGVLPQRPHTAVGWETDKKPTCTARGMRVKRCVYCGVVFDREEIEKTEHVYGEVQYYETPDCTKNQIVYQLCVTCGNKKEMLRMAGTHEYAWATVREPTCTTQGKQVQKCSVCGAEGPETNVLPAPGHQPSEWIYVIYPTATEEGLRRQICVRCGVVLAEYVIPPKSH